MARTKAGNPRTEESLFPCPHSDCPSRADNFHDLLAHKNRFTVNKRYTKNNGEVVTSYLCRICLKYFTDTNAPNRAFYKYTAFPARKLELLNLYNGGLSQRYLAQVARVNKKRMSKVLTEQGAMAKAFHLKAIKKKADEEIARGISNVFIEFDEQETYLRNKLHPISLPTVADRLTGFIIGFTLATFQPRRNNQRALAMNGGTAHPDTREEAFKELCEFIKLYARDRKIIICSDMKKEYKTWVVKYLPKALLYQVPSNTHRDDDGELKLDKSKSSYTRKVDKNGNTLLSTTPLIWGKVVVNKDNCAEISYTHKGVPFFLECREGMNHLYRIDHYFSMTRKNLARMRRKAHSTSKNMEALRDQLYIHLAVNNKYPMFADQTFYVKPSRSRAGYVAHAHEKHKAMFKDLRLTWREIRSLVCQKN